MRSLADPALDRRINIDGLRRILNGAIASGVERFVFISSGGAIYGETPGSADEETPPRPENPYGRHKLEGEAIVADAPLAGVSLRLSNVYGPRQRADTEGGVASIFAERMAAGLPLRIFGDGAQRRDFVHVADVVSAIMLGLDDGTMHGVWNVGTGAATSVNELAALMIEAFGEHTIIERLTARGEIAARASTSRSCWAAAAGPPRIHWRPRSRRWPAKPHTPRRDSVRTLGVIESGDIRGRAGQPFRRAGRSHQHEADQWETAPCGRAV